MRFFIRSDLPPPTAGAAAFYPAIYVADKSDARVEVVTVTGRIDATGTYLTRAFYGDYEAVVTHAGQTRTTRLKHAPGTAVHTLYLP